MLTRRKPLRRYTWIKPRNDERAAKNFERNFGARARRVREFPCCRCGTRPTEAAHVRARGMGGAKGDRHDLIPLCRACHREYDEGHVNRPELAAKAWGFDPRQVAADMSSQLTEEGYP